MSGGTIKQRIDYLTAWYLYRMYMELKPETRR